MIIKPTENWKLLGTDAELDTDCEYRASWATNQPDWLEERKIFVDHPEPIGFLLKRGEYVITDLSAGDISELKSHKHDH